MRQFRIVYPFTQEPAEIMQYNRASSLAQASPMRVFRHSINGSILYVNMLTTWTNV